MFTVVRTACVLGALVVAGCAAQGRHVSGSPVPPSPSDLLRHCGDVEVVVDNRVPRRPRGPWLRLVQGTRVYPDFCRVEKSYVWR